MTVKDRLRLLIERLSDEQAAEVLPLVEARIVAGSDAGTAAARALDRLHALTADLPPFDAVQAALEARRELDQRPAM